MQNLRFLSTLFGLLLLTNNLLGQTINTDFFQKADAFFQKNVQTNRVDYAALKGSTELQSLVQTIENATLDKLDNSTKKAFYINAYNLLVINQISRLYPIQSVKDETGFFDKNPVTIAGERTTLTDFEKNKLLLPYQDARLHFVLNCGAVSCPPITNFAYQPETLESQLESQTTLALNNPTFIKTQNGQVAVSQIFNWYASDFGAEDKAIIRFINQYRSDILPPTAKLTYYDYDWTLNDTNKPQAVTNKKKNNNASRYVVSSAIPKGSIEIKLFNNLYTQQTGTSKENRTNRATFMTSSLSFLYGLNNRFNVGFVTRYRRVRNDNLPSSPLGVFGTGEAGTSRQGFTGLGPQIRYAPFPQLKNFSIQSSFTFPIGKDLTGNATQPYIDWDGPIWNTQFFNDLALGDNFSLFTELDFLWEEIGSEGKFNRISTPVTLILSYRPTSAITLYTLGGYSPYWQTEYDYFAQGGLGAKYQFSANAELELLYTGFTNKGLKNTGGKASTYNIGFRYNL